MQALLNGNGKYIVQPEALNGGWIVQIHYTDMDRERYLNGDLQIAADGTATLTLDWYQLYNVAEKTYKDEKEMPNTTYRGSWNPNGSLSVSDGWDTIRIVAFSQWESGIQVGEGYYEPDDQTPGHPWMIYLVRPGRFATDFMDAEFLAELDRNVCYSDLDPQHRNTEPLTEGETLAETTDPPADSKPQDGGDFNGDGFPSVSTFEHPTIDELMWVANAAARFNPFVVTR